MKLIYLKHKNSKGTTYVTTDNEYDNYEVVSLISLKSGRTFTLERFNLVVVELTKRNVPVSVRPTLEFVKNELYKARMANKNSIIQDMKDSSEHVDLQLKEEFRTNDVVNAINKGVHKISAFAGDDSYICRNVTRNTVKLIFKMGINHLFYKL